MQGDGVTVRGHRRRRRHDPQRLARPDAAEIYSLLAQSPGPSTTHEVVLRTAGDPAVADSAAAIARRQFPNATLESVRTMEERIAASLARNRLYAVVLVAFGISALAITAVGLFGVLLYLVAQRTREIALRSALGARPRQIFRTRSSRRDSRGHGRTGDWRGRGLLLARYLTTLLYGVSSHDLVTFAIVGVVMIGIALARVFCRRCGRCALTR